ncbi:unnamed protein product [Rotaria sp. Silwood1]|nr:unnamed protein product [Rotaria sp. Silwood1]
MNPDFRTSCISVCRDPIDFSVNSATGLRWNTTGSTVAGTGVAGTSEPNRLYNPSDIALDSSDALYIADQSNNRVVKWIIDEPTGTTVAGQASGTAGSAAYELNKPGDIFVDSSYNLYVADTYNHRVQLWSSGAFTGRTVAGNGTNGSALNQLSFPNGVNLDSSSDILYVADTNNHRIMSYASNASIGTLVAGGNGSGTQSHQLYSPYAVHFDSPSNSLVIANYGSHNIVRWVLGASGWTLIAGYIGSSGITAMTLTNPTDAVLDPMGNIYVADYSNDRIQFFRAGQPNGTTIAGVTETPGNSPNLLYHPFSIALDKQLNLYVTDSSNHRVQKFQRY